MAVGAVSRVGWATTLVKMRVCVCACGVCVYVSVNIFGRSIWRQHANGQRTRGNGQLAKSVKYLSGKQHRDEAALLLSMFTSMSEWEQDIRQRKGQEVVATLQKMMRRGFRFSLSLFLLPSPCLCLLLFRLCPALCAFLLCFSSVDHIVPLGPRTADRHRLSAGKIVGQAHRGTH